MSRYCELTGKGVLSGNRVSHSNRRTKHKFYPNLQKKRFWSAELGRFVSLKVSTSAIRTIDKLGLDVYAKKAGIKLV
ncbi:MAG: 50S ribosomal protein L28 [Oligoflexales bacterium]|nr:50S ribosomal protein L28 [Oligoflexales bacterium]